MGREERVDDPLEGSGATVRRLLGLWWPEGRCGRWLSAVRFTVLVLSQLYVQATSTLKIFMETPPPELEEITMIGLVVFPSIGIVIKEFLFIYHGDTLKQLLKLLSDSSKRYNNTSSEAIRSSYMKLSSRVYLCMQVLVQTAVTSWVSAPLLVRFFFSSSDSLELNRQFPLPLWFPGRMYQSPTYEILYGFQAFGNYLTSVCTITIDSFFIHLKLMIAAELQVLSDNLALTQKVKVKSERQLDEGSKCETGKKIEEQSFLKNGQHTSTAFTNLEVVSDEMMCQLQVKNIKHHQVILRSVVLLQRAMSVSIFILLFSNMASICTCMFVTSLVFLRDGNVGNTLKLLVTSAAFFYETAMYCIFGQILTDQSEKLANSAFSCGWIEGNARFKQDILIFLMGAKDPLEIKVGKMNKLSKEMLVQVLKGSYGLLNLLHHFQSKN